MRKLSFLLLFAVVTAAVNAQTMSNYAGANFSATSVPGAFTPLTGSTAVSSLLVDDIASAPLPIGFTFYYMGKAYTQVRAGSDGYLSLYTSGTSSSITNNLSTGATVERPVLAPFWDDMDGRGTGAAASYLTSGTPGSRVFTFEWLNWVRTGGTTPVMSFQVKLFESTGIIQFIYRSDAAVLSGASASIGICAVATGSGNFVSLNNATNAPTTSTTTETTSISTKPATDQVYTFTPPQAAVADPTTITFSAVTLSGMTVNWVDNSTTETNFNVFRSLDGVNYTWVGVVNSTTTGATGGAYNFVATGLAAGTNYFWQIVANSEGVPSAPLSGSQVTNSCSIAGGTYTVGATGTYTSIANAVAALVANGITGPVVLELQTDYVPEAAFTLPFVPCASATNTITIRPAAGVGAPIVLTSAAASPMVNINGGQYYIIDGRNGGTGTNKFITLANSSTTGQALQFINEGANNIVRYCTIQGVTTSATSGVVVFSTTTGTNGNDNNTIDNCDIRDGATTPANLVYGSGTTTTSAQNNSGNTISNNNLFNFFIAGATDAAGVRVDAGNTDWTITGNSIYQTATRTSTAGATGRGIYINNASGNNFVVSGNFIGGSAASAGGTPWTNGGSFANRFEGIRLAVGTTTASSVQNNVIRNFAWSSSSGATTLPGVWAGIYISSGIANIGNVTPNIIGATTGTGSVAITCSTTGGVSVGIGSATTSTGNLNISNNTIGAITLIGSSATVSHSFNGIWVSNSITGSLTISGNTIGSTSTAGSIQYASAGTGTTAAVLQGILQASAPSLGATISGNTIANFTNTYNPATANSNFVIKGISATSGSNIISGNTVRNLGASAATTGTGSTASVMGIAMTSTSTTTGVTSIDQNTVSDLINTNATAASAVTGIHIGNATTGRNNVTRNLIYNLAVSTTSATADIRGISFTSGLDTVKNNMIRLGTDVTNGVPITGIWETGSSANSAIMFNSIYIGGAGVGTQTGNTYAFRTDQTINVRTFQNNIFINGRSNATTGGKHYAVRAAGTTPNPTGLALNYNDYQATGTGAVFGFFNSLDVASLVAWRTATGQDANSISGNPQFIDPAGAIPDLHISAVTPTEIEGVGLAVAAIADDYDGQVRASFTPTDLGADAGNFIPADLTPPVITYTLLPGTACVTDRTLTATITDVSGVNSTPGTKPRMYYKKSTDANTFAGNTNADNGWKFVEATNAASPFTFTTDYTLLQSAVVTGDVIEYFVTAQDLAATPNVAINSGTFAATPASVALTAGAFPIGGTINNYSIVSGLPTSVTVGAAGTYPTLSGTGGLFADINAKYLTGNTTVTILDAAITETGAVALLPINYGCTGGPFTLTIKPNTGVTTVLSGSVAGPLIDLAGADNVTFDGSNSGGSTKDMTIRNTNTGGQTFRFLNEATFNTIQNTIIEGANTSNSSGTIVFSTVASGTAGNSNNTINNCDIRDRSDAAGVPANAVYSSGSAGGLNTSNTVTNSNIFNWSGTAVFVTATGAGNTWTVSGNAFYQAASRTTSLTGISILGGSGHTVNTNSIGGAAANRSGVPITTTGTFTGISLTVGTAATTNVQGNTISNLNISGGTTQTWMGINIGGGNVNVGTTTGNVIGGGASVYDTIRTNYDSRGIYNTGAGVVDIQNNTIGNISYYRNSNDEMRGIRVNAGTNTIRNNIVRDLKSNATASTSFFLSGIDMLAATGGNLVEGNQVYNLTQTNGTAGSIFNVGMFIGGLTSGDIRKNKIYNIDATAASLLYGIYALSGSATYSNNMVAINPSSPTVNHFIGGLRDDGTGANNWYFNSVSIQGTSGAGTNSTYAYFRSGTVTVDIKNNILSNTRTGSTGFNVAIANTNAAATGWAATASNYNDLYSATPSTVAQWLGTGAANNRTLAGWKAAQGAGTPGSGGDANSFSELPVFTSATDLHIPNATATQIESGGTPAGGITTDIDNETRPGPTNNNGGGTQVDVGADEFDGTPASAMTYVSSTTTQANVSNVSLGTSNQQVIGIEIVTTGTLTPLDVTQFNLNTNGTTAPGTDITNAKLWYTGTSAVFATTTQYGTTVAAPNGAFSIAGTQPLSTGTNYFWLTYDVPCSGTISNVVDAECNTVVVGEAQTPTVQAPAGSRTIVAASGLSGTVTIGAAGTYPSITGVGGLFAAINTQGLSGNLTANIIDASVTETGAVALNAITGICGGPFTLLIKPNTTAVLTGTVGTGAIIKLNGADNVTIDGSNSGGTDRSLTIRNTTTTTTGNAVIWLASTAASNGANTNTIKNCIIEGNSSTTSFTGIHIGGSTTIGITSAGLEANNTNTINNNLFRKTIYGVTLFGFAAATPDQNNVISNNNFGTAVTGEGHSLLAINADRQSGLIVSGNEVQNVVNATTTSSTPFGGIRLLDFKNGLCFNNKVHDLAYTGTSTPKIYGIAMTNATYTTVGNPSNAQIYNNIVYRINSTGTSSVWNLTGILASAGYGDKISYNSVHLTGQLANNASGLAAAFANGDANITSVGTNIEVQNNSFSITGSSAVAGGNFWAYYTQATTLTGSVLNYNDLYAAGTNVTSNVGRFNATNYTTLAAWQAATAQDANSISSDPQYNGLNNLVPQLSSPLLNAGTPVAGITTDITGFTRSVTTPSIGAYEQGGDAAVPVITYTPLLFTCATADRTLSGVTITDASGVPTTGSLQPRIYFRKNAGSWFSTQGTLTSGSGTNGTWDFTISAATMGGLTTGDAVQYYVIAQDVAAVPNIGSNPAAGLVATDVNTVTTAPTTPNSYNISNTMGGTYTVGAGGNYTTLTAAVNAYNSSCLSSAVVFELTDAAYNTGETFPLQINVNPDASASKTLTIRPAAGVAATVSGSTTAIFKLSGADYVIIDGISTGGSSLTLSNTNTANGTTVVWIGSLGAAAGATNDTLRNCTILNGTLGSSTVVNFGVFVGQNSGAANGEDNDNIAITGNTIRNCVIGIQSIGGATAGQQNDNTFIDNNIIGDAVAANSIGRYGMNVGQSTNATVSRNTIQNVVTSDNAISASNNATGIIISTGATNSLFTKNKITGVRYTGTSGYGGKGFDINTGNVASNVTLTNNFVADILGDGWNALTSDAIVGIRITGTTGGINLYHNSVNLGSGTYAGNTSGTTTAALFINSAVTALDIRNNIFVNNLDNSNATDKSWAINSAAANTAFTNINYNDYSVSGTAGVLGFLVADLATLGDIQTATAQDANSISVAPVFVSATDLHLVTGSNCGLHRRGTPIAGITVDIDNETRSATKPDMGADEYANSTTGTMTWTGAVSTDWFDVRNWAACEIPGPTSNVVINGSLPNYPNVTSNVTINSLTLNTGSSLTAATGVVITLLSL